MAKVELKTVKQLLDKKFFVPLYQRGYRWDKQQVDDLLKDIDDFSTRNGFADSFYCLQPLAVRENVSDKDEFVKALRRAGESESAELLSETRKAIADNIRWEVIDGQQRLTTIYLILDALGIETPFEIKFARRLELTKPGEDDNGKTVDDHHIGIAKTAISDFFSNKDDIFKKNFLNTLKNKVQFIWYEVDEEDPVKVFTRLNIGKIALTNSELIKALFLNRSNFVGGDSERIRRQQTEIAGRWDEIEATLQDDEFWMFIHEPGFDKPTRIDFIFDLICEMDLLKLETEIGNRSKTAIGNDKYRTFRYFSKYFHSEGSSADKSNSADIIKQYWQEVDSMFAAFKEWFGDLTLYHYVGFLVACRENIMEDVLEAWRKADSKKAFVNYLKEKIKEVIGDASRNLDERYEIPKHPKTQCRPLLLLHNIQTVINQHADETARYGMATFYKFPFHLFKSESWNVEHIDSNTENSLENENDQKEWLKSAYCFLPEGEGWGKELKSRILKYFNPNGKDDDNETFEELYSAVGKHLPNESKLDDKGKNKIGNFTLLDETTNKSYGNAIFPVKRSILMGKLQGVQYKFEDECNEDGGITGFKMEPVRQDGSTDAKRRTSFVPPVTLRVFLKAYNPISGNPWFWDKTDAETYCINIRETLREFGVK